MLITSISFLIRCECVLLGNRNTTDAINKARNIHAHFLEHLVSLRISIEVQVVRVCISFNHFLLLCVCIYTPVYSYMLHLSPNSSRLWYSTIYFGTLRYTLVLYDRLWYSTIDFDTLR